MSTSATPRKSSIDPSVTTNGCTPMRAITAPCPTPMTIASTMAMVTAGTMPNPCIIVR